MSLSAFYIANAYVLGYEAGLKGLTVYRNNSRLAQPMNLEKKKEEPKVEETKAETIKYEFEFEVKIEKKVCPECGNTIEMAEGCFICLNCGYSGCS